jgi:hypothetical protein
MKLDPWAELKLAEKEASVRTASATTFLYLALSICVADAGAQQKPSDNIAVRPNGHAATSEPTAEDLLRRSYNVGRNLPPEERCPQLFALASAAGQMHSARARSIAKSWSRELFRCASDLSPGWNQEVWQKNSLQALSAVDPVAAFKLLPRLHAPEGGDVADIPEDLRAFAAQIIFSRLWDVKGPSALEDIKSAAREIGRTGEYPYLAMSSISTRLAERKNTNQVQLIFREALDFYSKGPHVRSANREFVRYLDTDWSYLPSSLQEEALKTIVGHLTRKQEPNPVVADVTQVTTDKGKISFQSDGIALLYAILPKVRDLSPDWAQALQDEYPDLRQAAANGTPQYSLSMRVVNTSGASPDQVAAVLNTGLQAGTLSRLRQRAASDPQQAASLVSSITDPGLQSEAWASLAIGFADKDPKQAADLLATAQKATDKLPAELAKLRALTTLAEAAITVRDLPRAEQAIERAFDLGEELLSEDLDLHPGDTVYDSEEFEELSKITRLGAQFAFSSTMARLDHLRSEVLQIYLLISAAEGLQQRTEKAAGRG